MTIIVATTILFATAAGGMLFLFPELKQKPREAITSLGVLALAYLISVAHSGGFLHITINEAIGRVLTLLSPSRWLGR